jgi:hypothetical protein
MRISLSCAIIACLFCLAAAPQVTLTRCPNDGIQPQAAVDAKGRIHLIYLKGPDGQSDVFYVRSDDGAKTWSTPIRVNSLPGSAIATGTVRGAQLALGRGGRWIHVAWMGSAIAEPKAPNDSTPMLYARLKDGAESFEAQRNLITAHPGLDGGGSVAADDAGNVYVAWHAPGGEIKGEAGRTLWLAKSSDDGSTFAPETDFLSQKTGACGCCGMRLGVAPDGSVIALYRAANDRTRDIYLASAGQSKRLAEWPVKTCPMSTATFAARDGKLLGAWESNQQVWLGLADGNDSVSPPGEGNNRKHPSVAASKDGAVLLAWSEGTGWKRGGSVAWQVFRGDGLTPAAGGRGMQNGLAVWSLPSAVWATDRFIVFY